MTKYDTKSLLPVSANYDVAVDHIFVFFSYIVPAAVETLDFQVIKQDDQEVKEQIVFDLAAGVRF